MGKLVAAFIMFLAASALAIHESRPSPPPPEEPVAVASREQAIDHTPPSRAVHDELPPWVKYATPPAPPVEPPHKLVVRTEPPSVITIDESTIDIPDVIDRCPDQPNDRDDNDGCPEPERDRITLLFE